MSLLERLTTPGPKRMLALDGGGIRGALTIGFLDRLQTLLRERTGRPDLLLRDYFDLIGGTSTGAILAVGLALGHDPADLRERYIALGREVFRKRPWWRWRSAFYDAQPLIAHLRAVFEDRTLGDPSIPTGLCIVAKRADTNSTWPMLNHPAGRFFDANKSIPLIDAVRASTAAPTVFIPQSIRIDPDSDGMFIDGGVSAAVNPALLMFLVATLRGYPFRWPRGENSLMLVSIGTGTWHRRRHPAHLSRRWIPQWLGDLPRWMADDANWQAQLILQAMSNSPTAWPIDREIGDLDGDLLTDEPALTYLRYNVELEQKRLADLGWPGLTERQLDRLRDMTAAESVETLADIGAAAAERQVEAGHLRRAFDVGADA